MLRYFALASFLLGLLATVVLAQEPSSSNETVAASPVHDPAAAQEVERAFKKLESLKSYRLRATSIPSTSEPLIYEVRPPDNFRMLQREKLGGFPGTSETISAGGKIAFRFVSPELDAHLAKMSATEQASFMMTMSGSLAQIVEAIASGGIWGLGFAADQAASLAAAVREQAKENPLEVYARWQCTEDAAPSETWTKKPDDVEQTEVVERLSPATLDGEKVLVYRSVSTLRNAMNEWSLDQRTYVLEKAGLPSRVEMDDLVFDYFDFDAPVTIEFPSCQKRL
jgi:hypothetical protein